jgi:uncharacterized membrane protein
MLPLVGDITNIISLAVTPAFLLLGVMLQLRVLNNRLERITDRREVLEQRLSVGNNLHAVLVHELSVLRRRTTAIHRALGTSTSCMIIVFSVVVTLFIDDAQHLNLDSLIAFLFVFAMLLLIVSFSLLLHEILLGTHPLPSTTLHRTRQAEGQC